MRWNILLNCKNLLFTCAMLKTVRVMKPNKKNSVGSNNIVIVLQLLYTYIKKWE